MNETKAKQILDNLGYMTVKRSHLTFMIIIFIVIMAGSVGYVISNNATQTKVNSVFFTSVNETAGFNQDTGEYDPDDKALTDIRVMTMAIASQEGSNLDYLKDYKYICIKNELRGV